MYFVFDVESVGLHGEGFAVGWVVVNEDGEELTCGILACPLEKAQGSDEDREWVKQNVPEHAWQGKYFTYASPMEVRQEFWRVWKLWKKQGAILVADCPWPVEARFLIECVNDDPKNRNWEGPYPFIDVASVRLAAGLDPLGTDERIEGESPAHDPQRDARQSARLFIEAMNLTRHVAPQASGL